MAEEDQNKLRVFFLTATLSAAEEGRQAWFSP